MKITPTSKVSELLYWSYANLAMAEKAVHDRNHLMDIPINEVQENPFSLESIPQTFPSPGSLTYSPFHARQGPMQE